CDKIRKEKFKNRSNEDKFKNFKTHPQAIYTSRLLNFKNLPKPVNSSDVPSFQVNSDDVPTNLRKVRRIEKDLIMGPNGGKAGLVMQDISISFYASELAVKSLSKEIGISEEEYKKYGRKRSN
ncbi:hypothetical protein RhiirC2_785423, partial [Rhizophagus irregularis]